ncbi:MAG TPA: hypothetical protein V6D08_15750 [Candidatus Obscuribacterales bacterium]
MQSTPQARWPQSVAGFGTPSCDSLGRRDERRIFAEVRFLRLADHWLESSRDAGLWGGDAFDHRVFRQYQLRWAPSVTMDFWFRGARVSPAAGRAFCEVLRRAQVLDRCQLSAIKEVLGVAAAGVDSGSAIEPVVRIESAETGSLKGRMVLAVRWENRKMKRQFLSVYIDAEGDGRTVREIHFSGPCDRFTQHLALVHEVLRSIQWQESCPPPLSLSASA